MSTEHSKNLKEKVNAFKESELKLLSTEEKGLVEIRKVVDEIINSATETKYLEMRELFELKNDIDDAIALIYSLRNMVEKREGFKTLARTARLVDGIHNFVDEAYKHLEEL